MEERMHENLIKITEYKLAAELPNPFIFDDGSSVLTEDDWSRRREEIYKSAIGIQYGGFPPEPEFLRVEPLCVPGGSRLAKYRIVTGRKEKPISFYMDIRMPNGPKDGELAPAVIIGDACFDYMYDKEYINAFIDHGVALVTFNRTELVPDLNDWHAQQLADHPTAQKLYCEAFREFLGPVRIGQMYDTYPDGEFGSIAAWAWGYSRCVDALEILGLTDMSCIAFSGHSRGAKTAIVAGAVDTRAAIVNPNETCAGGCSCYRIDIKAICEDGIERESESGGRLTERFPRWMGPELAKYAGRSEELPFDSHYLKAMVAPRILFVSEAASDIWANPVGSWQTSEAAKEVYKFLGCEENLLWYYRRGTHYHEIEDVEQLVNVVRHVKYGEPLNDKYFKKPFADIEPAYSWRAPQK